MSVPLCTAGEEKLAGEPGGRKGWSRRQAERAGEMLPAINTTEKGRKYRGRSERETRRERGDYMKQ